MIELLDEEKDPNNNKKENNEDDLQNKIISENMNKSILFTKTFKDEQMLNDKKELDEKLIEMPFLLLPIKFFNSHQGYIFFKLPFANGVGLERKA